MTDATGAAGPALEGVRVLELTTGLAGAYCGRLLAMLGADVVKVESRARPDESRLAGPFPGDQPDLDRSGRYAYLHAQKRSLALDVTAPSGAAILERLLPTCDVLIDDGALGIPSVARERYEAFLARHDQLVVAAFSPYGLDGPYADFPATELTELSAGGWMTGPTPEDEPLMTGAPMATYGAATFVATGVLLALTARRRFGHGQLVEVAMNEAFISLLAWPTVLFAYSGHDIFRLGDRFPFTIVPCADGHLGVSILTQRHWDGLVRLMGRDDLLTNPRFSSGASRATPEVVDEIMTIIRGWAATQPAYETYIEAQSRRVPLAIVPSPREVLASPQYADRAYWIDYQDPILGGLRVPGAPYKASPGTFAPFRPAPRLGGDAAALLDELGIDGETRVALAAAGVLG